MNIILGGALTNDNLYMMFDNYVIETYQDIDMRNIKHYKEMSELIYLRHFKDKYYDIIIGHSMGGLIIIDLLSKNKQINCDKIVIVESYIVEPQEEFRNIVYKNIDLKERLESIMHHEVKRYNSAIFESLRKINIIDELKNITIPIGFVYGMRGMNCEIFLQKLDFPQLDNINLIGIPDSSHFCLIENQRLFLEKLNDNK